MNINYATAHDLIDYAVIDKADQKIGTVHNLWTDEREQPAFLGVKTTWLFGKNHVVPVSTAMVNHASQAIRLPFTEETIKNAPSYDPDADLTPSDEANIYRYYNIARPEGAEREQRQQQQKPTINTPAAQIPGSTQAQPQQPTRAPSTAGQGTTMQLSEEQLKVGKREVEAGGVRLRKVIRTETVNKPVELKREEVVIERVPAGEKRPGETSFKQEDVFIPLRREEAVIEKESRVREEVRAKKQAETQQQTVSGQVRKEDVEIENEGEVKPRFGTEKEERQQPGRYEPKERSRR